MRWRIGDARSTLRNPASLLLLLDGGEHAVLLGETHETVVALAHSADLAADGVGLVIASSGHSAGLLVNQSHVDLRRWRRSNKLMRARQSKAKQGKARQSKAKQANAAKRILMYLPNTSVQWYSGAVVQWSLVVMWGMLFRLS